jgi:thioredoxin-related protein
VDGLEAELEGRAEVMRISLLSSVGRGLAVRYGVRGVPTMLVFDGTGEVIYGKGGMPDRAEIVATVEQLSQ